MRRAWGAALICLAGGAALAFFALSCKASPPTQTAQAPEMTGYDRYANQALGLSLNKPAGWRVVVHNDVIVVQDAAEGSTRVFLVPVYRVHPKMDAISFVRFVYGMALAEHPDLAIEERRSNADNTVAEVAARFTNSVTRQVTRGFYLVSIEGGRGLYCGYEAPAASFDTTHAVLRNVLTSLRLSPVTFYNATRGGQVYSDGSAPSQEEMAPTIDVGTLVVKLGSDRTMYLAVPADWTVGGGNYSLIAAPPDKTMGITSTNDAQPATRDPETYLLKALLPFYRATGTVLQKKEPNEDIMRFSRSQGYSSQATNFTGETTQGDGRRVRFWMMVNAATLPHGGGFVSTVGFYATPELFERNSRVLYAMTASMGPNQQEIMRVLHQNLDRLGQASRTMSATGDVVIQGLRSGSANLDRTIDKYNYYLSGEEARYSPLENRVYVVDSHLEQYAGNPRYPQEALTSVPDALWNRLPHERKSE